MRAIHQHREEIPGATATTAVTPPSFYTLTGNLLGERTLTFEDWAPGRTQRAKSESFQVGGKGINVAKMLRRLGLSATALCFTGGHSGAECVAWLRERGFDFRAFPSEKPTRQGTVVRSPGQPETTFLGPDAPPGADGIRACAEYLDDQPAHGVLAVCGSLPGWETANFDPLRAALERWLQRGRLVADTYGPPLAWFARRPLDLIKINRAEFEGLKPGPLDLRSAFPVHSWIITDGPNPVQIFDETGAVTELTPPPIREVSPTGSGDVLLACLLAALWHRNLSLSGALAFALPYAAANAAHPGVAEFPLSPN
jgi:fructose-1-phosphate kinase PfkB-like protein